MALRLRADNSLTKIISLSLQPNIAMPIRGKISFSSSPLSALLSQAAAAAAANLLVRLCATPFARYLRLIDNP
jgi:hypothetical protein